MPESFGTVGFIAQKSLYVKFKYVIIYKRRLLLKRIAQSVGEEEEERFVNTTQLECFLEVANCLNFSRAAERLRLTQPAVSHQIKSLEDELGVKLFYRTSKTVRLTQEGYLYIPYAGDILKLAGLSLTRLRECRTEQPFRLGIGCRSTEHLTLLRGTLVRLRKEGTALLPVFRLIPFESLENLLQEGDIQVMFTYEETAPKNGAYRPLADCPVACLCGTEHPLSERGEVTLEELMEAGQLAVCRPPVCPPSLFAIQSQLVTARGPGEVFFCEHQEEFTFLIEAGFAFGLTAALPGPVREGLRQIPLAGYPSLSFGAAYLPGDHDPQFWKLLRYLEEELG